MQRPWAAPLLRLQAATADVMRGQRVAR